MGPEHWPAIPSRNTTSKTTWRWHPMTSEKPHGTPMLRVGLSLSMSDALKGLFTGLTVIALIRMRSRYSRRSHAAIGYTTQEKLWLSSHYGLDQNPEAMRKNL